MSPSSFIPESEETKSGSDWMKGEMRGERNKEVEEGGMVPACWGVSDPHKGWQAPDPCYWTGKGGCSFLWLQGSVMCWAEFGESAWFGDGTLYWPKERGHTLYQAAPECNRVWRWSRWSRLLPGTWQFCFLIQMYVVPLLRHPCLLKATQSTAGDKAIHYQMKSSCHWLILITAAAGEWLLFFKKTMIYILASLSGSNHKYLVSRQMNT